MRVPSFGEESVDVGKDPPETQSWLVAGLESTDRTKRKAEGTETQRGQGTKGGED